MAPWKGRAESEGQKAQVAPTSHTGTFVPWKPLRGSPPAALGRGPPAARPLVAPSSSHLLHSETSTAKTCLGQAPDTCRAPAAHQAPVGKGHQDVAARTPARRTLSPGKQGLKGTSRRGGTASRERGLEHPDEHTKRGGRGHWSGGAQPLSLTPPGLLNLLHAAQSGPQTSTVGTAGLGRAVGSRGHVCQS